ncbi:MULTISPECIES: type II secretion system F family protein [Kocuria]|nr:MULTISPECIES: type II secretion system F family protein [Kocuria]
MTVLSVTAGVLCTVLALGVLLLPIGSRSRVLTTVARTDRHGPGGARDFRKLGSAGTGEPQEPRHAGPDGGPIIVLLRRIRPGQARRAAAESAEWVVWMRQLAALLRVGRTSGSAFEVAALSLAEAPDPSHTGRRINAVCSTVARATTIGRAPSVTLRSLAHQPAAQSPRLRRVEVSVLSDLARCWEVSERTGAPLAALLEGLAEATEADLDAAAARETALAGSRATVNILTCLPVLALGLGMLIGADPVRTLLTTPWGLAAGFVGAVLTVIGRIWTGRLVHRAEHAADAKPTRGASGRRNRSTRRRPGDLSAPASQAVAS